jgi:hypothetical protein
VKQNGGGNYPAAYFASALLLRTDEFNRNRAACDRNMKRECAIYRSLRGLPFATRHSAANIGVAPPAAWHLKYRAGDEWRPVADAGGYPTAVGSFVEVKFDPIITRSLRAVFDASGDGQQYAAVAVQEWEALGPKIVAPSSPPKPPAASDPQAGCSPKP